MRLDASVLDEVVELSLHLAADAVCAEDWNRAGRWADIAWRADRQICALRPGTGNRGRHDDGPRHEGRL